MVKVRIKWTDTICFRIRRHSRILQHKRVTPGSWKILMYEITVSPPLPRSESLLERTYLSKDQGYSHPFNPEWKCTSWLQLQDLQRPSWSLLGVSCPAEHCWMSVCLMCYTQNAGPWPQDPFLSSPSGLHVVSYSLAENPEENKPDCSGMCTNKDHLLTWLW